MEVIILPDSTQIGDVAAGAFERLLERKPDAVLGLATGSSPLSIYDELAARHAQGRISFQQARGFTPHEHVRLPAGWRFQRRTYTLQLRAKVPAAKMQQVAGMDLGFSFGP